MDLFTSYFRSAFTLRNADVYKKNLELGCERKDEFFYMRKVGS